MTPQKLAVALALLLLTGSQSAVRLNAITAGAPIPALELSPGGHFEWLVRLEGEEGRCSGSLVAAEWVLTAGHCQHASIAFIGDDTVGVAIVEAVAHPEVFSGESQHDAALLRLAAPSSVRPVTRMGSALNIVVGQELMLAGWGRTNPRGASVLEPSAAPAIVMATDSTLIHTEGPAIGCAGDSGGPLLFAGTLAGHIVASDAECSSFTASVRFSSIEQWVSSVAGSGPGDPPPGELGGELTVIAGQLFEIPLESFDPDIPMSLDFITEFDPGRLQIVSCREEIPIACRFVAPAGSGDLLFTYTVSDGRRSARARWIIHVITPNFAPVAEQGSFSAAPGVPKAVILPAVDVNGDPMTFAIVTAPAHGVLSDCSTGGCVYTSQAGYAGPDRFTWRASDGQLTSNVADMLIEVQPAQAPVVKAGSAYALPDSPAALLLEAFDPNGDRIEYSILTEPRHGTITFCSDEYCEYVADPGFLGIDSFTWFASDGRLDSLPATFTIEVLPHLPPFAHDDEFHGRVNTVRQFELASGDPDGNPVTLTLLTMPRHGTLTCLALVCEYRPQLDYAGVDSFTWRASDGDFSSRIATATLQTHASSWRVTPLDLAGDAHALAATIAGPGAIVSNAVLTGAPAAAGTFAGAADAIGLSGGVILGTGRVADAIGPNLAVFASTDHHLGGDPDLPAPSVDAVALRFDVVPTTSTFEVRYVFASEEYPLGVGAVDEAAAIMVNGRNCALVGSQHVGINSINHGNDELGIAATNPELLIANATVGALDAELNGITVVLTCTAAVVPGIPNQIKIVVADSVDGNGDSVLFIEGTTALNTPPAIAPLADITRPAVAAAGTVVTFVASGNDAEDGSLAAECLPASGTAFPIGETIVTCTVMDNGGATATDAFTVTITEPATPGDMTGAGFVRDGATRYQFSFDARENDRGERAKLNLRINSEAPKGKGKDRDDRFESRTVTFIAFSDDPAVHHRPRRPQVDTVLFSGVGEWNGMAGFRYEVSAQDEAEAGRRHRESIRVTVWNAAGEVVASFSGEVSGGVIRSKRLKH
jgi:hypothetical protein